MNSNYTFLIFLFTSFSSLAQERITLYLTSQGEVTKESKAYCKCESEFDFENFRLDGVMNCIYLDGSPKIKVTYSKGLKNGHCEIYYKSGKKLATGQYLNNKRYGIWLFYYPNGQLKQTIKFTDNVYSREFNSNIMVGEFYSEDGKQLIKEGNGKWHNDSIFFSLFDLTTLKSVSGEFKDSLKHGTWILRESDSKKRVQSEKFELGKFITGTVHYNDNTTTGTALSEGIHKMPDREKEFLYNIEAFNLDTTVFSDSIRYLDVEKIVEIITGRKFQIQNRDAGYLHGNYDLMEYISKNIRYPADARRLGYQGTVIVQVTIDKNSKAKNIKILKGIYPSLDNEALRIINSIKEWMCALNDGQPYEKTIGIPIKFSLN
jgi:TonB family protein